LPGTSAEIRLYNLLSDVRKLDLKDRKILSSIRVACVGLVALLLLRSLRIRTFVVPIKC
jgi:hypothetical protein